MEDLRAQELIQQLIGMKKSLRYLLAAKFVKGLEDFPLTNAEVIEHGVNRSGIKWVVVRGPYYNNANGYIRLPKKHFWNELDSSEIDTGIPIGGEITYRNGCWIGFDSLHHNQYWEGMAGPGFYFDEDRVEMNDEMVIEWTKGLADKARDEQLNFHNEAFIAHLNEHFASTYHPIDVTAYTYSDIDGNLIKGDDSK